MIKVQGKPWDSANAPTLKDRTAADARRQVARQAKQVIEDKGKVMASLMQSLNERCAHINALAGKLHIVSIQAGADTFFVYTTTSPQDVTKEDVAQVQGGDVITLTGVQSWRGGSVLAYKPTSIAINSQHNDCTKNK